ncbi:hypothetical protein MMC30_003626 [Trapelia coarctata]|nr:hypothetical protein [Trapelia coarctata]
MKLITHSPLDDRYSAAVSDSPASPPDPFLLRRIASYKAVRKAHGQSTIARQQLLNQHGFDYDKYSIEMLNDLLGRIKALQGFAQNVVYPRQPETEERETQGLPPDTDHGSLVADWQNKQRRAGERLKKVEEEPKGRVSAAGGIARRVGEAGRGR